MKWIINDISSDIKNKNWKIFHDKSKNFLVKDKQYPLKSAFINDNTSIKLSSEWLIINLINININEHVADKIITGVSTKIFINTIIIFSI